MIWKGHKIVTYGDLMTHGVDQCASPEEAKEFMKLYSMETKHARQNIGYLAGYYDNETKHRIFEWFDCFHPIFGKTDPTSEEAFQKGLEMGRALCKKRDVQ